MATQRYDIAHGEAAPETGHPAEGHSAPFAHVTCGVRAARSDGEAVRQASILSAPDGKLTFVCVRSASGSGRNAQSTISEYRAWRALKQAQKASAELDVKASTNLINDHDIWHGLAQASAAADLLVLGCCPGSRTAGVVLGMTTAEAVHRSQVPVLVARESDPGSFPGRVMLATDGSPDSHRAAELAASICRAHGSSASILTVGEDADREHRHELAEQSAELFVASGTEPVIIHREGAAGDEIVEVARDQMPSILVLGSRGRTGVRALGSVSEHVAQYAPCSVLVARHPHAPRH